MRVLLDECTPRRFRDALLVVLVFVPSEKFTGTHARSPRTFGLPRA